MNHDANYQASGLKLAKEEALSAANRDPGGNPDSSRRPQAPIPAAKAPVSADPVPVREAAPVPGEAAPKKRSRVPVIAAACLVCAAAALAAFLLRPSSGDSRPAMNDSYPTDSQASAQTRPAQAVDTLPPETEAPRETLSPDDRLYLEVQGICAAMADTGDLAGPLGVLREYTLQEGHDARFDALLSDYERLFIADRLAAIPALTGPGDYCRAIRDLELAYRILEAPEFADAMGRIRLEFGQFMNSQIAAGSNDVGQMNVSSWYDIVSISAGDTHTVGLKADGTLVATGYNEEYQCDMQLLMQNACGKRIVGIAAGYGHTLALLADGTVAATGVNAYGECDVYGWTDIVAIVAGSEISAGLRSDGTVVAAGLNTGRWNLESWQDIVCLAAGDYYLVGLKADGTVVAAGTNDANYSERGQMAVSGWSGITVIAAGNDHTVALRSDGTLLCIGSDDMDQCRCDGYPLH